MTQLYYQADGKTTTTVYDPADRAIIGPSSPPHFGGFSSTITYKGISLDVLFSYACGNYIYNNDRLNVENPIYWFSGLSAENAARNGSNLEISLTFQALSVIFIRRQPDTLKKVTTCVCGT